MDTITIKCAHCGATNNAQPGAEWTGAIRRMEREHAALLKERDAVQPLIDAVVAYFNKRGVKHAERRGDEDIAAIADALADYGFAANLALAAMEGEG